CRRCQVPYPRPFSDNDCGNSSRCEGGFASRAKGDEEQPSGLVSDPGHRRFQLFAGTKILAMRNGYFVEPLSQSAQNQFSQNAIKQVSALHRLCRALPGGVRYKERGAADSWDQVSL